MSLMEKFANPETFHTLSFADKMLGSTITLVLGMGLTIGVLLLVWAFIVLMTKVMNKSQKKQEVPAKEPAAVQPEMQEKNDGPDQQTIAAIVAAAVAAYQGSGGTSNLVVKKITRVSGNTSSWSASAREECMASRKI